MQEQVIFSRRHTGRQLQCLPPHNFTAEPGPHISLACNGNLISIFLVTEDQQYRSGVIGGGVPGILQLNVKRKTMTGNCSSREMRFPKYESVTQPFTDATHTTRGIPVIIHIVVVSGIQETEMHTFHFFFSVPGGRTIVLRLLPVE